MLLQCSLVAKPAQFVGKMQHVTGRDSGGLPSLA